MTEHRPQDKCPRGDGFWKHECSEPCCTEDRQGRLAERSDVPDGTQSADVPPGVRVNTHPSETVGIQPDPQRTCARSNECGKDFPDYCTDMHAPSYHQGARDERREWIKQDPDLRIINRDELHDRLREISDQYLAAAERLATEERDTLGATMELAQAVAVREAADDIRYFFKHAPSAPRLAEPGELL